MISDEAYAHLGNCSEFWHSYFHMLTLWETMIFSEKLFISAELVENNPLMYNIISRVSWIFKTGNYSL